MAKRFSPKQTGETILYGFDFTDDLATGETISSVEGGVIVVTVYSGTDATPSAILSGSPSISGNIVSQLITAGTSGVKYKLTCKVITTPDAQILELDGILKIRDI